MVGPLAVELLHAACRFRLRVTDEVKDGELLKAFELSRQKYKSRKQQVRCGVAFSKGSHVVKLAGQAWPGQLTCIFGLLHFPSSRPMHVPPTESCQCVSGVDAEAGLLLVCMWLLSWPGNTVHAMSL